MSIREAMEVGTRRYEEALGGLRRAGFDAQFTQTGGMCAAIEVKLERGYLLITDVDDSLPWNPRQQVGWGVGLYHSDDVCEGPLYFVDADGTGPDLLLGLVKRCLREGGRQMAT